MKQVKIILLLFVCSLSSVELINAQSVRQLRKTIELKMPRGGENGGTVAQNGKTRNFYATIAGNKTYSFAYFNQVGEMMSAPDLSLLADVRGLWYNSALKTFQGNTFGNGGWVTYVMDDYGVPFDVKPFLPGQLQPHPNSVAQYNLRENLVHFLKGSTVVSYNAATGAEVKEKTFLLKTGYSKKVPPPTDLVIDSNTVLSKYNTTTVVYTGISNAEFGLLNIQTKEIELYSKNDGLMYQKLKLPADAIVKDKLNFSFSNNTYFLYDSRNRTWVGYR
ncbi:MAG TPA: hypothetical protein VL946_00140 [Lacibacter sp.]|nr:hypothetical protein [Lacibacter sp.]